MLDTYSACISPSCCCVPVPAHGSYGAHTSLQFLQHTQKPRDTKQTGSCCMHRGVHACWGSGISGINVFKCEGQQHTPPLTITHLSNENEMHRLKFEAYVIDKHYLIISWYLHVRNGVAVAALVGSPADPRRNFTQ